MSNRASIAITLITLCAITIAQGGAPTRIVILIPYWLTVAASYLLFFVIILWLKHDLKPWLEPIVRFLEELLYTDAE